MVNPGLLLLLLLITSLSNHHVYTILVSPFFLGGGAYLFPQIVSYSLSLDPTYSVPSLIHAT